MNIGVAPPDFSTEVGKLRLNIGDTDYEPLDPPVVGQGNYQMFSDVELTGYLDAGDNSISRATGLVYLAIAGMVAKDASLIKTFDLSVDNRNAPEQLRLIAKEWFVRSDEEDAAADINESFLIVPTGKRGCPRVPEGAPYPCACGGSCVV